MEWNVFLPNFSCGFGLRILFVILTSKDQFGRIRDGVKGSLLERIDLEAGFVEVLLVLIS